MWECSDFSVRNHTVHRPTVVSKLKESANNNMNKIISKKIRSHYPRDAHQASCVVNEVGR